MNALDVTIDRRRFMRRAAAGLLGMAAAARSGWAIPETATARPFRLTVMLWTLRPKYTAEQGIELVARAGYSGFELVDEDKKWDAADVARIRTRMKQLSLVCDAMSGIETGFAERDAALRLVEQLSARMEQAERLDCRRIILLSGKRDPSMTRDRQHAVCVENLKHAGEAAAKHRFELLLEPIDALENPSIYLTRVAEAFDIARVVKTSSVSVLYDFYHEQRGLPANAGLVPEMTQLLAPLRGNMDLLGLVHVADVPGRHAPGTGTMDYAAIYRGLRKQGYRGWMAMEFLPMGDAVEELRKAATETGAA